MMVGEFDADELDPTALPRWLARELTTPAPPGKRHEQMLRLAPALFRVGWNEEAVVEQLRSMYDADVPDREIDGVVRWSADQVTNSDAAAQDQRQSSSGRRLRQIEAKAKASLPTILADYSLPEEGIASAIAATSPVNLPADPHKQTSLFLSTMFAAEDVVWIGRKIDSGNPHNRRNFRPVADWLGSAAFTCEFTCASTFKPGSCCRRDADVAQRRYTVVESDGLSFGQTAGVFRFLETRPGWRLCAVVYSGGKSLHGWFDGAPLTWPPEELAAFIRGLSCDQATLRRSQPVRLAGVRRSDTGHHQSLLYLSPAAHTL